MSVLKTILCALSFVTTVFAMDELYQRGSGGRVVRGQLPVVEYPDLCGIDNVDNVDIDRLISSKDTPFVGKAIPVNIRTVQAVNLADDFSKEKEIESADGTQASGSDQTLKIEIEQTGDDSESDAKSEAGSLKSVEIVLIDAKAVKEISSAGCCAIQ